MNHGVDVERQFGSSQKHLVHIAAKNGHIKIVKLLLAKNSDWLNLQDTVGQTPLLWAAGGGHVDIVEYLADLGADLTLATYWPGETNHGKSPVYWATARGHLPVVQCLMNHGVDVDIRFGNSQKHLIHIAARNGHVGIVNVLLAKNSDFLNLIDAYGQTPLLLATSAGHEDIVNCLMRLGADLTLAINKPGSREHGFTPLTLALELGHNGVASHLILNNITAENQNAMLLRVQTAELALELMTREPAMVEILLKNTRIAELIHRLDNCHIKEKSIKWYKYHGRRPSWFVDINTNTGISSVYKPGEKLGEGTHGIVRAFIDSKNHQKIVVKSLKDNVMISNVNSIGELDREADFNKKAYPDERFMEAFPFIYTKNNQNIYTGRLVSDYIEADDVELLIPKITQQRHLAEIVYAIIHELYRIHSDPNIQIIHFDIKEDNIKVRFEKNKIYVRFMDFGMSRYRSEKHFMTLTREASEHYAPESRGKYPGKVMPNINQDIYSLGNMLNALFIDHPLYQKLMDAYPSIDRFISESQSVNPNNRPSLQAFCEQLKSELSLEPNVSTSPTNKDEEQSNSSRLQTTAVFTSGSVPTLFYKKPAGGDAAENNYIYSPL